VRNEWPQGQSGTSLRILTLVDRLVRLQHVLNDLSAPLSAKDVARMQSTLGGKQTIGYLVDYGVLRH
jgi:hypothetical protein